MEIQINNQTYLWVGGRRSIRYNITYEGFIYDVDINIQNKTYDEVMKDLANKAFDLHKPKKTVYRAYGLPEGMNLSQEGELSGYLPDDAGVYDVQIVVTQE